MLTTIILHGKIGRLFEREWKLDVANVSQAFAVIGRAKGESFFEFFIDSEKKGLVFQAVADGKPISCVEELKLLKAERVEIRPIIVGSKRQGVVQTIVGVVLVIVAIVIAVYSGGSAAGASASLMAKATAGLAASKMAAFTMMMGLSMTIGGVAQMLAPSPQLGSVTGTDENRSYIFSGASMSSRQGVALPVGYGRLHVGAVVISAGMESNVSGTSWYGYNSDGSVSDNGPGDNPPQWFDYTRHQFFGRAGDSYNYVVDPWKSNIDTPNDQLD